MPRLEVLSTNLDTFGRLRGLAAPQLHRRLRTNWPGSLRQGNPRPPHPLRSRAVETKRDWLRRNTVRCFMGRRREYCIFYVK
jgi:hypothetical protein